MSWEIVIGLEVHAQLATKSKIFSGSSTTYGAEPNTQASLIDLGFPGVLPVLNEEAVRMAVLFGLAVGATIDQRSIFARKNYFYPDLPKGYQISQFEAPIVAGGQISIDLENGQSKTIMLTRAHLEEDAGKSIHDAFDQHTGVDLNRAGTPLLEIVSEPDMRSAGEAVAYLKKVHALVQYLQICDGNMQEGSFRCDANVSVRPVGQEELGTRTELKNLNSFRFIEKAINLEVERQVELIEDGSTVVQETRLYDPDNNVTRAMRSKEEANDYRYFPDPDLLPVVIEDELIEQLRSELPELPDARRARYQQELGLSEYDAVVLTNNKAHSDYFEELCEALPGQAKLSANWVLGELTAALNNENISADQAKVEPKAVAQLLTRVIDNTVSSSLAKDVFAAMWQGEGSPDDIIEAKGLKQISDPDAIADMIKQVMENHPDQLAQYRSGKDKLFGFFVGKVMQLAQGKANPAQVNQLLKSLLNETP
ncbi:MAG: Asp-tRNA(Asn)/Glu-tRNA(Gln) amidotransferase subunit GatB [Gammaproteobacteria bacterium]